jgi:ketosteroid isomerase-like protein
MTEHTPTLAADIDTVRAIYAAINRNDIAAAAACFDPQIERIEPPGFATAGTYRGIADVSAHLSSGRSTWAEGSCIVEEIIAAGDKIVVYVHALVRLKDRTDWIDGRFADGWMFRDGRATLMRSFAARAEAMAWASGNHLA